MVSVQDNTMGQRAFWAHTFLSFSPQKDRELGLSASVAVAGLTQALPTWEMPCLPL